MVEGEEGSGSNNDEGEQGGVGNYEKMMTEAEAEEVVGEVEVEGW